MCSAFRPAPDECAIRRPHSSKASAEGALRGGKGAHTSRHKSLEKIGLRQIDRLGHLPELRPGKVRASFDERACRGVFLVSLPRSVERQRPLSYRYRNRRPRADMVFCLFVRFLLTSRKKSTAGREGRGA